MKTLLKFLAAATLSLSFIIGANVQIQNYQDVQGLSAPIDMGWVAPEEGGYGQTEARDVPSGAGEIRLLYKDWEKATGYVYIPRHQVAPDCVGQSTAGGLDLRVAVQSLEGPYLPPQIETDASSIYALSRIEIGSTVWAAGSQVSWAMQAMNEYGALYKKNYLYAGYDLSSYDPSVSRSWGRSGLPDILEPIAKITPVVDYYQVTTYEEVRDAIYNGYPVVVGSNVGFSQRTIFTWGRVKATRDSDGFLRRRGVWKHAMLFGGVDDRSPRRGVCCMNSWGPSWVSGQTKLGQPPGSFWIDTRTVTQMVQQNDAFAIVRVNSPLDYRLTQ